MPLRIGLDLDPSGFSFTLTSADRLLFRASPQFLSQMTTRDFHNQEIGPSTLGFTLARMIQKFSDLSGIWFDRKSHIQIIQNAVLSSSSRLPITIVSGLAPR